MQRRRDAFVDTLKGHGFNCHVCEYSAHGKRSDWFDESTDARNWLISLPKPVAVMSCHDYRAGDIIRACGQAGLRVPEDVAVLGVDNDSLECSLCKNVGII